MYRNYLVTAARNLTREKLYSFINIAGLAVAGAAALIIAWITVIAHALRVARANPIHALRYE